MKPMLILTLSLLATACADQAESAAIQTPSATPPAERQVNAIGFDAYVAKLKQEARAKGISATTVDKAFEQVHFIERAVHHDKAQPEFKLTVITSYSIHYTKLYESPWRPRRHRS